MMIQPMNALMDYQRGPQGYTMPRPRGHTPMFGQGNPFVLGAPGYGGYGGFQGKPQLPMALGAPGMGGYGGPMKPQLPMQLGLQQNKRRKPNMGTNVPGMMPRNAFLGGFGPRPFGVRPY